MHYPQIELFEIHGVGVLVKHFEAEVAENGDAVVMVIAVVSTAVM